MIAFTIIWILLAIASGVFALYCKKNFLLYMVYSIFLSPITAVAILIINGNIKNKSANKEANKSVDVISCKQILLMGSILWLIIIITVIISKPELKHSDKSKNTIEMEMYSKQREPLDWFNSIGTITTLSSDNITISVKITFGYKKDDEDTFAELASNIHEIIDFEKKYFHSKKHQK